VPPGILGETNYIDRLIAEDRNIATLDAPLHADKQFLRNLEDLCSLGISYDILPVALQVLKQVEREIGLPLGSSFDHQNIATGVHGVGHVARVMFWIALLTSIAHDCNLFVPMADLKAALFAGFFHDLCRTSDEADDWHGEEAVRAHSIFLQRKLEIGAYGRCVTAISYHCKEQLPPRSDFVWQLLKDADALDRGRFRTPNDPYGCDLGRLVLPIWHRHRKLAESCGWMAYWLARMTKYIDWGDSISLSLSDTLTRSFSALSRYSDLTEQQQLLAKMLKQEITAVVPNEAQIQLML
jgi:hypothetical protein